MAEPVAEVRGEGLLAAVEFAKDPETGIMFDPSEKIGPQIAAALMKRGVIARAMPQGDILGFAPPLCLNRDEAEIIAAQAKEAVRQILG